VSAKGVDARERLRQWLVSGRPPVPADDADAEALVAAAREQRLVALLHASIADPGSRETEGWPVAVVDALAAEHRQLLARGVGQLDLMTRVTALLEARGLRALPLKGAALAESLYASVAERPMGDVDALALDDWDASVRALSDAGFACAERADHAWSFVDPETRGLLELHHSVTSCPEVFPLGADEVWARTERAAGQVARVPGAEDLLVQLAEHALFQHGGVLSLVQWLDLRRLLERRPLDPARLAAAAGAPNVAVCVRLAVSAARVMVGAPDLSRLAGEPPLSRGLRRWLDEVRDDPLRALAPGAPPPLARLRWDLAAGRRWSLLRGTLVPPAEGRKGETSWASASAVVRRAAGLAWRWGGTVWR
jgi:Uncharacterised nucleotidyltransferase